MTLIEVLVVMAVVMVIILAILPQLLRPRPYQRSTRIACVNGLKQVGLAFRIWAGDNNDKYPMSMSVTNGGTMELVESGTVWRHFQIMSNELNTPKILFCPADSDPNRRMATLWDRSPSANSDPFPFLSDTNTSYFIGVDGTDTNPNMFLAGDRNLTVKNVALRPGLHSLATNEMIGWTKEIHVNQGNVLMADASVQWLSAASLQKALENTGVTTNRLALP